MCKVSDTRGDHPRSLCSGQPVTLVLVPGNDERVMTSCVLSLTCRLSGR